MQQVILPQPKNDPFVLDVVDDEEEEDDNDLGKLCVDNELVGRSLEAKKFREIR